MIYKNEKTFNVSKELEDIILDINHGITNKTKEIKLKCGDRESRVLAIQLTDNGEPFDLTGLTARMYVLKPDNTKVFLSADITIPEYGNLMVTLTEQVLSAVGKAKCEIVLTSEEDYLLSTAIFQIKIEESINDRNVLESTDDFSALVDTLSQFDGLQHKMQILKDETNQSVQNLKEEIKQENLKTNSELTNLTNVLYSSFVNEKEIENFTSYKPNDFYIRLDKIVAEYSHLVSETNLGKDSTNEYFIKMYHYTPNNYQKTIFLVGGIHGNERFGSYAIVKFLENIVDKSNSSFLYEYIRNHCRVLMIPCANPWGMYQSPSKRHNGRGVDLNRNFDWKWSENPTNEGTDYYKGTAPFSEAESQYIRDVLNTYVIDVFLDLHNFPNADYENKYDVILYGDDKTVSICQDLVQYATKEIENPNVLYSIGNNDSSSNNWASYVKGYPSLNVEGCVYSHIWDEKDALKWLNIYLNSILFMGNIATFKRKDAYSISLNGKYSDNEVTLPTNTANKTLTRYTRELVIPSDGIVLVNGAITVKQTDSTAFSSFECVINQKNGFTQKESVNINYGNGQTFTVPINLSVPVVFNGNNAEFMLKGLLEGNGISSIKRLNIYITFIPSQNNSLSNVEVGNRY